MIESVSISRSEDDRSRKNNFDTVTNSTNSSSPSPLVVSNVLVLWNVYLESSKFVIEYVFMCAVFVGVIGYICYPDKFFSSQMEEDNRVIRLSPIDIMSVLFAIYVVHIIIFASGVLPYLLCDLVLPFKKSNRQRIYLHFVLMSFFLGFIFISCWYDLWPQWINGARI